MAAQAQSQPTNRRTEVDFPPNLAVTVSMKYAQPKLVSGQHGERYMFTTSDNRVFFCDPPVAAQIESAGINTNESFTITKQTSGKPGAPVAWLVARIAATPQAGPQPNGTYVVPRDPDTAIASAAVAPKPMARAEHVSSMSLAEEAKAAVDAFAEVLHYGLTSHEGRVKPDEIQRIFTTVYIQRRGAA